MTHIKAILVRWVPRMAVAWVLTMCAFTGFVLHDTPETFDPSDKVTVGNAEWLAEHYNCKDEFPPDEIAFPKAVIFAKGTSVYYVKADTGKLFHWEFVKGKTIEVTGHYSDIVRDKESSVLYDTLVAALDNKNPKNLVVYGFCS